MSRNPWHIFKREKKRDAIQTNLEAIFFFFFFTFFNCLNGNTDVKTSGVCFDLFSPFILLFSEDKQTQNNRDRSGRHLKIESARCGKPETSNCVCIHIRLFMFSSLITKRERSSEPTTCHNLSPKI